jgi:pimeloyl-ACP methyl ester carboxylesterase
MDTVTLNPSSRAPMKRAETPAWIMPGRRLLQTGMRLLGSLSPVHAAKLMHRLWFSAPRSTPRPAEQATLDSGTRLSFDVQGRNVTAWAWGDEGPTVLLLHGWGGYAGQMHLFIEPLRMAGFRVVAFDAPAHGASAPGKHGGRTVTFFEFADALDIVAAGESSVAGIIAHSGGCTAIALALRAGWQAPATLVFVSPFAQPSASVDGFAHAIGANARVVAEFSAGVEQWLGHPWSYLDIATLDDAHKQHRLLVVHDEEDREVPLSQARAVADSWPSSQLMVTRGLGHRRLLRDPAVIERVLAFLGNGSLATPAKAATYLPRDSRSALDAAYEDFVSCGSATGTHR